MKALEAAFDEALQAALDQAEAACGAALSCLQEK